MEALRRASYEYMRKSLIFYRNEIQKMTGKDPLEQFGISEEARFQLSNLPREGQSARISSQCLEVGTMQRDTLTRVELRARETKGTVTASVKYRAHYRTKFC
jgi:hypothetical protein